MSSKEETKNRILETALNSFTTLGYARSTTQAIADKAGVAEITLFRHFGDKKKLFQAAVKELTRDVPWNIIEQQLPGSLEDDLIFIARKLLFFFIKQRNAISMLMFESGNFPEMRGAIAQSPHGTLLFLKSYFEDHIDKGSINSEKPLILSQMFISMFFGYVIGIEYVKDLLNLEDSLETISQEFVKTFLNGIIKKEI